MAATLLMAIAAAACFALSLRFPPLYESTVNVDVVADVSPLPPEMIRPGSRVPSAAELERAYYVGLDAPRPGWLFADRVVKRLEAGYGWQVQGFLMQEIQDGLLTTKRGERGLTIRVRNYNLWRAQQFATAMRDVLRDDGARFFAGGAAVRAVRVTVLIHPAGPARRWWCARRAWPAVRSRRCSRARWPWPWRWAWRSSCTR